MPNRYVRASAIESEPVNALSCQAEVFYRRLLNRADDFGRYTANPNLLRASLFPLQLDRVSVKETERLLAECVNVGLVFLYESQGKALLVMNKWEKGRALHSEYAEPPADLIERMKTYVYRCLHMSPTPTPFPIPTPTTTAPPLDVPLKLRTQKFLNAWERWQTIRRGMGKVKNWLELFRSQLTFLERFEPDVAAEILETSLRNGYTGIFEPKTYGNNHGHPKENPRNAGTIKGPTDYGEAGKRKQERQGAEAAEREARYLAKKMAQDALAQARTDSLSQ